MTTIRPIIIEDIIAIN
jgi:hypothetical protein